MIQALKRLFSPSTSVEPTPCTEYITMESGLCYRMLRVNVSDGFEYISQQLQPGEQLYRMMDGDFMSNGEPCPVPVHDESDFNASVKRMAIFGWSFHLAAGIPTAIKSRTS